MCSCSIIAGWPKNSRNNIQYSKPALLISKTSQILVEIPSRDYSDMGSIHFSSVGLTFFAAHFFLRVDFDRNIRSISRKIIPSVSFWSTKLDEGFQAKQNNPPTKIPSLHAEYLLLCFFLRLFVGINAHEPLLCL